MRKSNSSPFVIQALGKHTPQLYHGCVPMKWWVSRQGRESSVQNAFNPHSENIFLTKRMKAHHKNAKNYWNFLTTNTGNSLNFLPTLQNFSNFKLGQTLKKIANSKLTRKRFMNTYQCSPKIPTLTKIPVITVARLSAKGFHESIRIDNI